MSAEPTPTAPSIPQVTLGTLPRDKKSERFVWFYQIVIGTLVFLMAFAAIMGWQMMRCSDFFTKAMVGTPSTLAPIDLTADEEAELKKYGTDYVNAIESKKDFDALLTPRELNDIFMRQLARQRTPGKAADNEFILLQTGIDGDVVTLQGTYAMPGGQYFNFDARGEFAIENGRITFYIDSVKSRGEDAPWLAMKWIRNMTQKVANDLQDPFPPGSMPDPTVPGAGKIPERTERLRAIKLFKRENNKFHVILDGSKLPPVEK